MHNGQQTCMGFLIVHKEHVFDATMGKVAVTPEQAAEHNRVYDECHVKGLDDCEVGQGGTFYMNRTTKVVSSFMGTVIGTIKPGTKHLLERKGRTYRIKKGEGESVFVKRVA